MVVACQNKMVLGLPEDMRRSKIVLKVQMKQMNWYGIYVKSKKNVVDPEK